MNPDMQGQPGGVINPSQPQTTGSPVPPQPQTMAGQDMFQPSVPSYPQPAVATPPIGQPVSSQPGFPQAQTPQAPIQPITKLPTNKKPSKKLPLIIGGSLIGVLLLITVGAVLLSGGSKQPAQQEAPQTQGLEGPQPATAIDVEQANNAITQDVTGHDNTKDFPDDMLSDKALGL